MRITLFYLFLFLLQTVVSSKNNYTPLNGEPQQGLDSNIHGYKKYMIDFDNWIEQYAVEFNSEEHFYDILKKWIVNELYIKKMNSKKMSYTLGHNQFSGMDELDFKTHIMKNNDIFTYTSRSRNYIESNSSLLLPSYVNWVEAGYVSNVKDQGQCGSCWAFSTTGALEGSYGIKYGKLLSFSVQQLVDCDNWKNGGKDHGCNGGMMNNAFTWINQNNGLCQDSDYPYVSYNGKTETCQTTCANVPNSKILSYVDVLEGDTYLMNALVQQPVSVAIEADQKDFQLYKSGVFTGECGTNLDHGVLAVGYGTESNKDYYLVKNSWGEGWGENGYIKIGRGEYNNGKGQCGILMEGMYPQL